MRRGGWLMAGTVIGVVGALGAMLLVQGGLAAPPADAVEPDEPQRGTAPVERRTLEVSESFDGTLGYRGSLELRHGLAGTVTALPEAGEILERGDAVVEVDDERAATLLYGALPSWRTLQQGVSRGEDVRQLEENLIALGYLDGDDVEPDRRFGPATTRAVKRWQRDLGVDVTGIVNAGDVMYVEGPIRVTDVALSLGSPARAGDVALTASSTERVVTVELDADRQDVIGTGDDVSVELPDGTTVEGRVEEIGSVATETPETGEVTVTVTIALSDPNATGTLDGAPVEVSIVRDAREQVLTVPVDALLALREGGYAVEVVDGAETRLVGVDLGLFQDGVVEVEGELDEGDLVVVPA